MMATPERPGREAGGNKQTERRRFSVERVREDFPALRQRVHGKPLVYLDNAATAQKPQAMLDAMAHAYTDLCANIHRGVHLLSARATDAYEGTRKGVARFINAPETREVVFVRGTTEAINLVAQTYGRVHVHRDDEVLISMLEHHSNIVPWQMLCQERGAHLKVVPINTAGELCMDALEAMLTPRTRIVAISHISNALGTINPIKEICALAHAQGAVVLVDGAQAVPHVPVDVTDLGCDFYAFSAHKLYGPTGVGVLYGRAPLLEAMPPYQGGGDMIASVTFEKTTYNVVPHKFEAGTPDIAAVIALQASLDYLRDIDLPGAFAYEEELLAYGTEALSSIDGLTLVGTAARKAGVLAFTLACAHPHDIGTILDQDGIAVRSGHHCAQPVMQFYNVAATARASIGLYNTRAEIDALVRALHKVQRMFA
jgi:cysteine desulfurase/selenocysteine lyase